MLRQDATITGANIMSMIEGFRSVETDGGRDHVVAARSAKNSRSNKEYSVVWLAHLTQSGDGDISSTRRARGISSYDRFRVRCQGNRISK